MKQTALHVALAVSGVGWTLIGCLLLLAVATSAIAMGALGLIPGGVGWLAQGASVWFGNEQLALAALAIGTGWGAFALGLFDLAWLDLRADAGPSSKREAVRLLAWNLAVAAVAPIAVWVVARDVLARML